METSFSIKVELDKTAETFRISHAERQELLNQWEATIEQMQKRDRDMDAAALVGLLSFLHFNKLIVRSFSESELYCCIK